MVLIFNRSISADGNTLFFNDATEYLSGSEARNALALIALAIFKPSTGNVVIAPQVYNPETVENFAFDVTNNDGVYEAKFWGLPIYTGQSLTDGDIVFDPGDDQLKKRISGVLAPITVQSLLDEPPQDVAGTKMALITTELTIKRDELELKQLAKQKDLQENCCEFHDYQRLHNQYNYVRSLRAASFIDFCRGNYVNAQLKVETGNTFGAQALAEAA